MSTQHRKWLTFICGIVLISAGGLVFVITDAYFQIVGNEKQIIRTGELLTRVPYEKLVIEIDYMQNYQPGCEALAVFKSKLEAYTEKVQIEILVDEMLLDKDVVGKGLGEIEARWRDNHRTGTTNSVYVLYLSHISIFWIPMEKIGGIAYGETAFAVAKSSVGNNTTIEAFVLLHEFGHLLGLSHSRNVSSVMYPTLPEAPVIEFDTRELAQLADYKLKYEQLLLGPKATMRIAWQVVAIGLVATGVVATLVAFYLIMRNYLNKKLRKKLWKLRTTK